MIRMNTKMEVFLKKDRLQEKSNILELCDDIVLKTKCINDCILYDAQGNLEHKKINWDFVMKINKDLTGYEVSHNEILLEDNIFFVDDIMIFLEELKHQLEHKFPFKQFCFIISYSERGALRFHTYRPNEGLWVSSELEKYETPILYAM